MKRSLRFQKRIPFAIALSSLIIFSVFLYSIAKSQAEGDEYTVAEIFDTYYEALNDVSEPAVRERMKCMLDLVNRGADDRVLNPVYAEKYPELAEKHNWYDFKEPESPEVERLYMWHAYQGLIDAFRQAAEARHETSMRETAVIILEDFHNTIHEGYAYVLRLEATSQLGGGSTYSRAQKAYHDWVSERQRSRQSVYSAWHPDCGNFQY